MLIRSHSRGQGGFTLTEVLAAVLLFGIGVQAFLSAMNMCNCMASYAKHKAQAIYTAQRIVEEKRRTTFATLASQNYGAVSIDTKGTFNTTADDFMGTAVVTVTNLDAYRKRVKVQVSWREKTMTGSVTKSEFCTTDIANEAQLN